MRIAPSSWSRSAGDFDRQATVEQATCGYAGAAAAMAAVRVAVTAFAWASIATPALVLEKDGQLYRRHLVPYPRSLP
jgi:hypothetical protein